MVGLGEGLRDVERPALAFVQNPDDVDPLGRPLPTVLDLRGDLLAGGLDGRRDERHVFGSEVLRRWTIFSSRGIVCQETQRRWSVTPWSEPMTGVHYVG